jgi:malate dehydrogenase (oxaloacetate-decarboxylating)
MIEKRISCLPVSMGQGAIGMVTEKDILGKVVATGADSRKIHVGDIMSTPLILATMDITIGEAAKKMMENNIRRLVVSDQNGRLLGLVTMTDLIRWVARGDEHATAVSDFLGSESQ